MFSIVVRKELTRLERFMREHGIGPERLARESGYTRQYLLRVRRGEVSPTLECVGSIVYALRELTHEDVDASALFDLEIHRSRRSGRLPRRKAS